MKNVVAYIRVSTDGQIGEDKFGMDVQREQIEDYCRRNDMNILRWYSDEGESGAKFRPGFDEIVYGDVTNPPYEAVVVAKTDRVARDINVYFYYQGALLRKNVDLISISEDFGQMGVFANALKMFVVTAAQMERDNINKRTSAGRAVKAARGGYSGGRAPYGYRVENKALVVVPEQAKIVRVIFEMRDLGATLQAIEAEVNSRGATNRSGKPFVFSTIKTILDNRKVYEGYYKYGEKGEWVRGQHEAIIKEKGEE